MKNYNRSRRFDLAAPQSSANSANPNVSASLSSPWPRTLMDPCPTPWYKREFDVHVALDKGGAVQVEPS
jgi:hypothetical protein